MPNTFLTAEWRKLAMANYSIDEKLLLKYLPKKTELDLWQGRCYVSLIGFMFMETRLMGFKIPFHVNFEEVNLRFYVRYLDGQEWKRGVVFIKEIVPKPGLSFIANTLYNEHYETMPMRHSWEQEDGKLYVSYEWKKNAWNSFSITTKDRPSPIVSGSEEEFITEHYWGYTESFPGKTSEYGVQHPRWEVYKTLDYSVNVDFQDVYGAEFAFLQQEKPVSVFLAEGSEVSVKQGRAL
jgi:uncharacterized protein YqjF (DUF2071 family)